MSTRTRAAGVLTAITMTALLASCSSSGSGDDSGADAASSADSGGTSRAFGATSGADGESADGKGVATSSASRPAAAPATERAIIATGAVSLVSKDVAEARREVQRIVDARGGDVTEEDTETDDDGETSYARLVLRVPSPVFGETMEDLEQAAKLRSSTRGSEDVTTQVIDTRVRVRAQEASLERVELLLAEAKTLKDVIWIESQLTSRQADLDSLKSQQAWLEDQTSLSTITVDISAAVGEAREKPDDEPAGFLAGLEGGAKALGATFVVVSTVVGALLPFAVLALVLGLPAWLVVRRRRSARAVPQPPAA